MVNKADMTQLTEQRIKQVLTRYEALGGLFIRSARTILLLKDGVPVVIATIFEVADEALSEHVADFIAHAPQDIRFLLAFIGQLSAENRQLEAALTSERKQAAHIRESAGFVLAGQASYRAQVERLENELADILTRFEASQRDAAAYRVGLQILRIGASSEAAGHIDAVLKEAQTGKGTAERVADWEEWWAANEWMLKGYGIKKP